MKLKQLSKTFLKVGKIINLVLIPLFAVLLIVFLILDIVGIGKAVGNDEAVVAAVGDLVGHIITYSLLTVFCIVALILNLKADNILETAQSKEEAKKGAIMAIVAGALVTTFPIVSGILMLCTKEEDWGQPQETPTQE